MEKETGATRVEFGQRLIIAEIGMTHEGSLGQAESLVKAAAESGVDAVKFQMHISAEETIHNAPNPPYFKSESRYEFFERTAFDRKQWEELRDYCRNLGLKFIVSPFSIEAVKRLQAIGVDAIKIPSGEVTNIPYLEYIASTDIPVIISSGMSAWDEVLACVDIFEKKNCDYAVLQCTSEYPCLPENVNLKMIEVMQKTFPGKTIGFSDHTEGEWAAVAAWTLGAKIIEKHFTISKKMYGPDAKMSMEPHEMEQLCHSIKQLETALNTPIKQKEAEDFPEMRKIFQKSIVAKRKIEEGERITEDMLAYKKPGTGLPTKYYKDIIGKKIKRALEEDDIFMYDDIEWEEEQ